MTVTAGQPVTDQAAYAEAYTVLNACERPTDLYEALCGRLTVHLQLIDRHGLDEIGQKAMRRAQAWIAAGRDVAADKDAAAARWDYSREVELASPVEIDMSCVEGFAVGRWAK